MIPTKFVIPQKLPQVSIVIVYYDYPKLLERTLTSISKAKTRIKYEVVVVDNSKGIVSEKKLVRLNKFLRYIKSPSNIGYGAGNNLGIKNSKAKYILILNPDVELTDNMLDRLYKKLKGSKRIAAVSPVFYNGKGREFHQIGSKIPTPLSALFILTFLSKVLPGNRYLSSYWDFSKEYTEVLPGSAFMVKRRAFEKAGMFDEKMFLFFEEFDLFKRMSTLRYRFCYVPNAFIYHRWSLPRKHSKFLENHFKKSRYYFFKKHYGTFPALVVELFSRISGQGVDLN